MKAYFLQGYIKRSSNFCLFRCVSYCVIRQIRVLFRLHVCSWNIKGKPLVPRGECARSACGDWAAPPHPARGSLCRGSENTKKRKAPWRALRAYFASGTHCFFMTKIYLSNAIFKSGKCFGCTARLAGPRVAAHSVRGFQRSLVWTGLDWQALWRIIICIHSHEWISIPNLFGYWWGYESFSRQERTIQRLSVSW